MKKENIKMTANYKWEVIFVKSLKQVRLYAQIREGKGIQQAAYSTYHDAMTVIDWKTMRIVTNLDPSEVK